MGKKNPPGGYDSTPMPPQPSSETYTLKLTFHGANNLPPADLGARSSDPFVLAQCNTDRRTRNKHDPHVRFRSATAYKTLDPKWEAVWVVAGVPASGAEFKIRVYDEDDGTHDDELGKIHLHTGRVSASYSLDRQVFELSKRGANVRAWGAKALLKPCVPEARQDATITVSIENLGRTDPEVGKVYTANSFYWVHFSSILGRLTDTVAPDPDAGGDEDMDFQANELQLAGPAPNGLYHRYVEFLPFVKSMFQAKNLRGKAMHALLHREHERVYHFDARTRYGRLRNSHERAQRFLDMAHWGEGDRVFTYVVTLDGLLRFTETGPEFGIDMLSKHTMHSDVDEWICVSGEFFVRRYKPGDPDGNVLKGVTTGDGAKGVKPAVKKEIDGLEINTVYDGGGGYGGDGPEGERRGPMEVKGHGADARDERRSRGALVGAARQRHRQKSEDEADGYHTAEEYDEKRASASFPKPPPNDQAYNAYIGTNPDPATTLYDTQPTSKAVMLSPGLSGPQPGTAEGALAAYGGGPRDGAGLRGRKGFIATRTVETESASGRRVVEHSRVERIQARGGEPKEHREFTRVEHPAPPRIANGGGGGARIEEIDDEPSSPARPAANGTIVPNGVAANGVNGARGEDGPQANGPQVNGAKANGAKVNGISVPNGTAGLNGVPGAADAKLKDARFGPPGAQEPKLRSAEAQARINRPPSGHASVHGSMHESMYAAPVPARASASFDQTREEEGEEHLHDAHADVNGHPQSHFMEDGEVLAPRKKNGVLGSRLDRNRARHQRDQPAARDRTPAQGVSPTKASSPTKAKKAKGQKEEDGEQEPSRSYAHLAKAGSTERKERGRREVTPLSAAALAKHNSLHERDTRDIPAGEADEIRNLLHAGTPSPPKAASPTQPKKRNSPPAAPYAPHTARAQNETAKYASAKFTRGAPLHVAQGVANLRELTPNGARVGDAGAPQISALHLPDQVGAAFVELDPHPNDTVGVLAGPAQPEALDFSDSDDDVPDGGYLVYANERGGRPVEADPYGEKARRRAEEEKAAAAEAERQRKVDEKEERRREKEARREERKERKEEKKEEKEARKKREREQREKEKYEKEMQREKERREKEEHDREEAQKREQERMEREAAGKGQREEEEKAKAHEALLATRDEPPHTKAPVGAAAVNGGSPQKPKHGERTKSGRITKEKHVHPVETNWILGPESGGSTDPADYQLIIDNDSGTYRPDKNLMPLFQAWLEKEFAGLHVMVMSCDDDRLQQMKKRRQEKKKERNKGAVWGRRSSSGSVSSLSSSDEDEYKEGRAPRGKREKGLEFLEHPGQQVKGKLHPGHAHKEKQ